MPSVSAKPAGRQVKCPHCWGDFFTRSETLYVTTSGEKVKPSLVADWDDPTDGNGHKFTTRRCCPHCNLEVSTRLLETNSVFVSIVGTPSSGKTYFLASMYQKAKSQLTRDFHKGVNFPGVSGELVSRYFDRLVGGGDSDKLVDLPKTQEGGFELYSEIEVSGVTQQFPKPFTLRLTDPHTRDAFAVVTYDNAGESYVNADRLSSKSKSIDHLEHCDMVIVVIDPVQIPELAKELKARGVEDPQLDTISGTAQDEMLNSVLDRAVGLRGTEKKLLRTPVCVVVQKWDMLQSAGLVPAIERVDPSTGNQTPLFDESPLNVSQHGDTYVDTEEIRAISVGVRDILYQYDPNIVNSLQASFEVVRYFPCSALGSSPELNPANNKYCFRPKNVKPYRVTDPLLWLLAREGVVMASGPSKDSNEFPASKRLKRINGSQFQIQSPYSPSRWINIDNEYLQQKHDSLLPDFEEQNWFVVKPEKYWKQSEEKSPTGHKIYVAMSAEEIKENRSKVVKKSRTKKWLFWQRGER